MNYLELFKEAVINFQLTDLPSTVELQKMRGIDGKTTSQLLVSEKNELVLAQVFLYAISNGIVPIVIPKLWAKERIEQVVCQFPNAHFWQNGVLKLSSEVADLPPSLENTYGVFSSGVTGKPKISFLKTDAALKNARAHAKSLNITSSTVILKVLPLDHAFGLLAYVWTPIAIGCSVNFLEVFEGWNSLRKTASSNSIIHLTPAWVRYLLKTDSEFQTSPPKISIGSAPLHQDALEALKGLTKAQIYITYGLTEAGPRVSTGLWNSLPENDGRNFIGRALDSVDLKILTTENKVASFGSGQLLIKSPSLKVNLETNEMIDDYYKTNDFAEIRQDGQIYLSSRDRFSFKFRDLFIDLNDLALICKNDYTLIAVVWTERNYHYWRLIICGENSESVKNSFLLNLETKARPAEVLWLPSIPKTSLGKIDFNEIVRLLKFDNSNKYDFYYSQLEPYSIQHK